MAPKCTNDCREIVEDLPSGPSQTSNKPPSIVQRANDPGFITQAGAQPEMVFISQPRILGTGGVPLGNLNGRYVYDSSAGIGTTVYMIDSVSIISEPRLYLLIKL